MIVTALADARNRREEADAQTQLREAVDGVSTTVFPKDVSFDLDGRTANGGPAEIRFTVFAISVDSPLFGRWGATYTPNPTIAVGRVYEQWLGISDGDYIKLIAGPSVGFFHFAMQFDSGQLNRTEALVVPGPHLQLDDLMQRQFVCFMNSPELVEVRTAELLLKSA